MFAIIVVAFFTVLFLVMISPFIEAVVLAAFLGGMLYPVHRWLVAHRMRPAIAAGTTSLLVLIAVVVPVLLVAAAVSREAVRLTESVAPWVERQAQSADLAFELPGWVPFGERLEPYREELLGRLGGAVTTAGSWLIDRASRLTQGTVLFVLNLFILLYSLFFFLLMGPRWLAAFDYTPLTPRDRELILEKGVAITRATLKGTVLIGLVQGALTGIAFAVAGIAAPVLWGTVAALASLVPAVGAALVWAPAVVYLLLAEQPLAALALAGWGLLVISTIDNILRPRLVGSETRMPDLLILLSTLGGIAMFGATGVIIGPIVAGFLLSSWHIFAATFRRELETSEAAAPLLERPPRSDTADPPRPSAPPP